tara:strand:- start:254 stop:577 length:324 start_codon:yes stop_codon:yes gene_type:complete
MILLLITGCIHNYEPVIKSITADPNPVSPGGIVSLTCNASDDDESSRLKEESLGYSWSAAYGEIISENEDNKATWTAPSLLGDYSISCTVNDQYNGIDIFTIDISVE